MRNTKIEANRLRLARLRYFDEVANAVEIPSEEAYAFLVDVHGTYINPFNPFEEVPVYDRTNYTNTTLDGVSYGTKIVLASGEVKDGPCYVLEKNDGREIFDKEEVTIKDLEDYMFASQDFFFDRMEVAKANRWKPKEMLYRYTQMSDDYIKLMHLDMYLNREEKALEKVK